MASIVAIRLVQMVAVRLPTLMALLTALALISAYAQELFSRLEPATAPLKH